MRAADGSPPLGRRGRRRRRRPDGRAGRSPPLAVTAATSGSRSAMARATASSGLADEPVDEGDRGPLDLRRRIGQAVGRDDRGSSGGVGRTGSGASDEVERRLSPSRPSPRRGPVRSGRGERPAAAGPPAGSGRAPRRRTRRRADPASKQTQVGLGALGALVIGRCQRLVEAREPASPVRGEVASEGGEAGVEQSLPHRRSRVAARSRKRTPQVSPKNFSWLARLSSPPPSTSNSRQTSTSRSPGSSATSSAARR